MPLAQRLAAVSLLAIALGGFATAGWSVWAFRDHDPEGAPVQCLDRGKLCVGAQASLSTIVNEHGAGLGKLTSTTCGYVEAGDAGTSPDLIRGSAACPGPRYVLSFSDGRRLKNVWIDDERVVRLDNYPAHPLES